MTEYECSPEREMWQPPERPLRRLPKHHATPAPERRIVILEPNTPSPEPPSDTSERLAPLRATLAAIESKTEREDDN